ncbi:Transcriptional regulator, LysR family [Rubellimicrobium mesophilum DSM 19309]|uniref:Transcriptional regulator, LysR family n=1 Tax=Rubellimicrobium mesophilum DSM 19309 TaxID=442562 RepID=A0A017HQ58_9RHOB|nr:LysR family transcriptional regulator [Rubellimicrobium mesophilum]EYD76496.1 Transcriptional regulator, LysR family [Rubellimicrobium mesophilum DSM 19309]
MPRNLDLASLRSLVTVADTGSVTKAAGLVHLTQSAVSMQLKRLEETLGLELLDRTGRGVSLTPCGELLVGYARRMLSINDEAWRRLSARDEAGEIVLGVPFDIVYPAVPQVLRRFARDYPRVKVNLLSDYTRMLQAGFEKGEIDVILTTEDGPRPGAETLVVSPLIWVGAPGGVAWQSSPLRIAFCRDCIFRQPVQKRLDEVGIPWEMAIESSSDQMVYATVSADLAIHAAIAGHEPYSSERIDHGGVLPELWSVHINLYSRDSGASPAQKDLVELIRREFGGSVSSPARSGAEMARAVPA